MPRRKARHDVLVRIAHVGSDNRVLGTLSLQKTQKT